MKKSMFIYILIIFVICSCGKLEPKKGFNLSNDNISAFSIGPAKVVHISYYDGVKKFLKYATNKSGSWVTSIVDSSGNAGAHSSIKLDSSGKIHISYYSRNNSLKYATNKTGSWVIHTPVASNVKNSRTSIAVDSSNKIHIAYRSTGLKLMYVTNKSGSWNNQTADGNGEVGQYASIFVQSNGNVHIAHFESYDKYNLKYTYKIGSTWSSERVDTQDRVGNNCSLVVDSTGKVHVSYTWTDHAQYNTQYSIKYAYGNAGSWNIAEVEEAPESIGWNSVIALDRNRRPHIAYNFHNNGNDSLRYAVKYNGKWSALQVEGGGQSGDTATHGIGFTMDSNNNAHIAYSSSVGLKYALRSGTGWDICVIDGGGSLIGNFVSLTTEP